MNDFEKMIAMLQARAEKYKALADEMLFWSKKDVTEESQENFRVASARFDVRVDEIMDIIKEVKFLEAK